MKNLDLDAMCADALAVVGAVIERRCRQVSYSVIEDFRAARSRCGHRYTVVRDDLSVTLPAFYSCPECGSTIWAEVVEWDTEDGRPTESGVRVACLVDVEETLAALLADVGDLPTWSHYYAPSEWSALTARAQAWVRANVRVAG